MWVTVKIVNIVPQNFKKSKKKNLKASAAIKYLIKWDFSHPLQ